MYRIIDGMHAEVEQCQMDEEEKVGPNAQGV